MSGKEARLSGREQIITMIALGPGMPSMRYIFISFIYHKWSISLQCVRALSFSLSVCLSLSL